MQALGVKLEFKYLEIDDPRIKDVMALFEQGKDSGGTSSMSLESALKGLATSVVLVCIDDERIIGAIEFSPIDSEEVRIRNLVVEESRRRGGIGGELLARAETRIKSDYTPVFIKTIPMPYSYALFSKFGYSWDSNSEYDWYKAFHSIQSV
ncbi:MULTISPECIES: GNAT family N-acetyltransferase [unclassified Vibrio]|uniref:GNAT family N-acetyltransferase n=1 Tax=unclassified Vibrio TaxID=2614977 RepID=UPI001F539A90|nr:GNAT family N-acetyltransferase [Vibrio sp. 10N.261.54.E10]